MRQALFACLALAGAVVGPFPRCEAAEVGGGRFSINPTLVVLPPGATSVLVALGNESDAAMRFQLAAYAWDQAPEGEMKLAPTEDIVFFPQMLTLGPGESRNVRVATLLAPGAIERSYRLFIEELPASEAAGKAGAVQMLARVGIPIFVPPPRKVEEAEIRDIVRSADVLSFTLANTGNVYFVPEQVAVKTLAHDGATLGERTLRGWYVLAGGTRMFRTDLPGLALPNAAEVLVEARIGGTTVTRRLDLATRVSR